AVMKDINELTSRIDSAISAAREKVRKEQQDLLQDHPTRQKRLEKYEQVQTRVREVARPRLKALAEKFGDRVKVSPSVTQSSGSVKFDFQARVARVDLTFAVAPDLDVRNAVVSYNLNIIPILMKFDSHSEFTSPIDDFDADGLANWLDERIIGFVDTFIRLYENEYYSRSEYVTDPVANVRFPKFAAGATLEHNGQT